MAIVKIKKLIEDLESGSTQVLSSIGMVATTANYAGTARYANSAGSGTSGTSGTSGSSGRGTTNAPPIINPSGYFSSVYPDTKKGERHLNNARRILWLK